MSIHGLNLRLKRFFTFYLSAISQDKLNQAHFRDTASYRKLNFFKLLNLILYLEMFKTCIFIIEVFWNSSCDFQDVTKIIVS